MRREGEPASNFHREQLAQTSVTTPSPDDKIRPTTLGR